MIRITIVMAALLLVLGCQEAPSTEGSAMSSTLVGAQPLHFAATNGDVELVKLLLDRGATINAATQDGWTALHFACLRGDKGLVSTDSRSRCGREHDNQVRFVGVEHCNV